MITLTETKRNTRKRTMIDQSKSEKSICLTCSLANWEKTKSGRLHPNGSGRCAFVFVQQAIPSAFYWLSGHKPSGGYISRSNPVLQCPKWLPIDSGESSLRSEVEE